MSASESNSSSTTCSSTMIVVTDLAEPPPTLESTTTNSTYLLSSSSSSPPPELDLPLSWPPDGKLSLDWIHNLIACFDWSSKNLPPSELPSVLPVNVFDSLVLVASKMLHKEPNCLSIDPFRSNSDSGADSVETVVVVGDVHGQLHDLLFLLRDAGYPSDNRIFIFNGDYVDRGAWGLETFVLLLAWKVFLPHNIYLLRGNHESKYCTSVYGFEKEVLTKYGDKGKHAYRKCLGCFEGLPLASIIAGCVYTAHGGLFRSIPVTPSKRPKGKKNRRIVVNPDVRCLSLGSFEELSTARRSVLDPPWEGPNLIPGDVLWSDPSMTPGLSPNKERGIGLWWGPDCTEEFLKSHQLKLIIRSHEGPDAREKRDGFAGMEEGYSIDHVVESGKLITLFSAPDYPQFQATEKRYNNKGAYVVLQPPDFGTPIFHSFEAVTPRPKANAFYDYEDVIDSDEELDLASMVTA
ncbi:Serine/threonine-protein phosphatase [Quillaja saponaria]|uniref:Serine/threonine-protein phosphatase n=1 Tax=Quillaja saponaria TaxID=32244 RepID=A0AAD7L8A5_QUISA|nr:Serine/threonine-protein phosphatase [Quillaja saponaria]